MIENSFVNKRPRPLTIWVVAIGLLIFGVVAGLLAVRNILQYREAFPDYPLRYAAFPILKIAPVLVTGVGLFLRWRWSRWVAMLLIAGWICFAVYNTIARGPSVTVMADAMQIDTEDGGYKLGRILGMIVFCSIAAAIVFALAFSKRVRAYFHPAFAQETQPDGASNAGYPS